MELWKMFFFKACPKCQGDLHLDRDSYGAFVNLDGI